MDLKILYDTIPPWDWPKDAARMFQEIVDNQYSRCCPRGFGAA
jgi:hypothetical protein